jgi:hypothetical protein
MEIFQKYFEAKISLSPEEVLRRVESFQGKNTTVTHSRDGDSYLVEVIQSSIVTKSYLRFRIWRPDENMQFSDLAGSASAHMDWYGFSLPFFLLLTLPCCACFALMTTPPYWQYGTGYRAPAISDSWSPFIVIAALLAVLLFIIILEILFAIFARNRYINELLILFQYDDSLVREKEKRDKIKY